MTMRTIGFIDYYLDNWHSANFPALIAKQGRGWQVGLAWGQADRPGGITNDAWFAKMGISQAASPQRLIDACDAIMVLAPNDPQTHAQLCALPLASGKPVFVDKTFAPDLATARQLFELADAHATPIYTTSALRYMPEFAALPAEGITNQDVLFAQTRGPGAPHNYSIHQLEMLVSIMGEGALRARASGNTACPILEYEFAGERYASITFMPGAPFEITLLLQGKPIRLESRADYWQPFIRSVLAFFESGHSPVPRKQTLSVIAMYEAIQAAMRCPDCWVSVPGV